MPVLAERAALALYEASRLDSDGRIPQDRRTLCGILVLAGLRGGGRAPMAPLELDARPLGRIAIATSYDKGCTKTGVERRVPIHPVLAAILAEWRLAWPGLYGRQPGPGDLVVP